MNLYCYTVNPGLLEISFFFKSVFSPYISVVKSDFFGYDLSDIFFLSFTPAFPYSYASCGSLVNQTLLC